MNALHTFHSVPTSLMFSRSFVMVSKDLSTMNKKYLNSGLGEPSLAFRIGEVSWSFCGKLAG